MPARASDAAAAARAIALPPGTRVALHSCPQRGAGAWFVVAAPPGIDAAPDSLTRPGAVAALLTHAPGVRRPDVAGRALAEATLARGGAVGFAFGALADALTLAAALRRGAA
jgi:hypothetical protein